MALRGIPVSEHSTTPQQSPPEGAATTRPAPVKGWDEELIRGIVAKHRDTHGGLIPCLS